MNPIKLVLLLTILSFRGYSQSDKSQTEIIETIDSLKTVITNAKHDSTKIQALLAWDLLIYASDPKLDYILTKRVDSLTKENLRKKLNTAEHLFFTEAQAAVYNNLGGIYLYKGRTDSAFILFEQSLQFYETTKNFIQVGKVAGNLGGIHSYYGNIDKAFSFYNKSIKYALLTKDYNTAANSYSGIGSIYEKKGERDSLNTMLSLALLCLDSADSEANLTLYSNIYLSIGQNYKTQGNYVLALSNYKKSYDMAEKSKNLYQQAGICINIGNLFKDQREFKDAIAYYSECKNIGEKYGFLIRKAQGVDGIAQLLSAQEKYHLSIAKFKEASDIYQLINDNSGKARALHNIGVNFADLNLLDSSFQYLKQSLIIKEQLNQPTELASTLNSIGSVYLKLGYPSKARDYSERALKIAEENNNIDLLLAIYESMFEIYESIGDFKSSLKMHKLFMATRDIVNSEKNQKELFKRKYEIEYEKQAALDSLANVEKEKLAKEELNKQKAVSDKQKAEIKQKRTQQYALFGGLGLLFIFTGFVYNRFRVTRKQKGIIENQKSEVETQRDIANEQKEEAERQKHIVEEKNQEIMDSITYAKRLQEAILPPPRLVKEWLTDSFLFYKPKDIVAGDFYWMETVEAEIEGKKKTLIFFAAADCTGHGVPGAMVSVVCANALNRSVKEFQLKDPGHVLDKVTELVVESFEQSDYEVKDGMDIALCALDISSKKLYYSGANNPLWIVTEKQANSENKYINDAGTRELVEYKATKQPVGKYEGQKQFETIEIQLKPGDAMYIFSDGFADQFGGEKGKKYKYANFKRFLLSNYDKQMGDQKTALESEFMNWKRDLEQIDDVCVIGVRVNGKERNNFTARELEVLEHLREGLPSKLIADKMGISTHTVDTYRRRLLAKTGTYNATELINYCLEKEVI